ncbi:DivIVA domain-containing protein [Limosilactobacillus sp. c9Ua_26_M]|uniref:DivIVA domain-containing protein n=1 Tax=Limosilactobacillus urinaemulieris TaxID=2742600 RepID=A0ABR8ZM35_9LACO|nr:DivIVA domain-containing protein [Limosilactobacillus urinaemulieris]
MSLTVDEINQIQFNTKMRGYNPTEVNDFIKEVGQTVQELTDQNRALQEKVKADESKLKYFSELKDSLNKSILVAQEAADKVKNNAKREADIMVREAQKQATDIVSTANEKANQIVENTAEGTRKLTSETSDLKKQTRIFRQRLQVMLESQLEVVKSDEWDKLLANDDIDKYGEIQNILGTRLDNNSGESVESTSITTSDFESESTTATVADETTSGSVAIESNVVSDSAVTPDSEVVVKSEESESAPASSAETISFNSPTDFASAFADTSAVAQSDESEAQSTTTNDSVASPSTESSNSEDEGDTVVVFPDNN